MATKKRRPKVTKKAESKAKKKAAKRKAKKLSKYEKLARYAAALEKRLQKYERRTFAGPLRPGQKPRKPSDTRLEAVRAKLKLFLEGAKRQLEANEVSATYRSHLNADYSIDAEIRVPVETEGDFDANMIEIEDSAEWNSMAEFWVMIGLKLEAEELTGSPTIDRRPQRAWTNPVRGNRSGAAFFTSRETVAPKLQALGAKVNMVVIRLFWHPQNNRPHRPRK